jgi:hypothetical protein
MTNKDLNGARCGDDFHVTSVLANLREHAVLDDGATLDEKTLGALGYKSEFKRYV